MQTTIDIDERVESGTLPAPILEELAVMRAPRVSPGALAGEIEPAA